MRTLAPLEHTLPEVLLNQVSAQHAQQANIAKKDQVQQRHVPQILIVQVQPHSQMIVQLELTIQVLEILHHLTVKLVHLAIFVQAVQIQLHAQLVLF